MAVPLAVLAAGLACVSTALAEPLKPQKIKFTSEAPPGAVVEGPSYEVKAEDEGGGSPNPIVFSIESKSESVCTISGATVSFIGKGTCTIEANQAGNSEWEVAQQVPQSFSVKGKPQELAFTSTAPNPGAVGGVYSVGTTATSGLPVVLTSGTPEVCGATGPTTVQLLRAGECTIEATQAGNPQWEPAPSVVQKFAVVQRPQTITFTSTPPSSGTVGGSYTIGATASSGLPVSFSSATPAVCSVTAQTVRFLTPGTCTVGAAQPGDVEYAEAPSKQQTFAVLPATGPGSPPPTTHVTTVVIVPDSTFKVLGATLNLRNYQITFTEQVHDPGTFTWMLTFKNGPFGVFAKSSKACPAGKVRLGGRCRPARILFAKGSEYVPVAGNVTFTVVPTAAGMKALKKAFKNKKSLPVRAVVLFQSAHGGASVTHIQQLVVRLAK